MSTHTPSADAQAIALACALLEARGAGAAKPLTPGEWHDLTLALAGHRWNDRATSSA